MNPPVLAVHTSARPSGVSYLERTLDELEREGALDWPGRRIVFHDGKPATMRAGWEHHSSASRRGNRLASWHLFDLVGDADLVVLEDDMIACRNAVRAALALQVPERCAFVTMFDHIHDIDDAGLHLVVFPGPTFRHAQALKIPARTVRWLRGAGVPHHADDLRINSRDWALGYRLRFSPWREYGIVAPNWFEHVGVVSTMDVRRRTDPLVSSCWAGPDYDALSWEPIERARAAVEVPEGIEHVVRFRML